MTTLDLVLDYLRDGISIIGVAVICIGALRALYQLIMLLVYKKYSENEIRLRLGESIILGLDFTVGADIVGSVIEPDYYSLGLLAIIVGIRTVLSFFLGMEIKELKPFAGQKQ